LSSLPSSPFNDKSIATIRYIAGPACFCIPVLGYVSMRSRSLRFLFVNSFFYEFPSLPHLRDAKPLTPWLGADNVSNRILRVFSAHQLSARVWVRGGEGVASVTIPFVFRTQKILGCRTLAVSWMFILCTPHGNVRFRLLSSKTARGRIMFNNICARLPASVVMYNNRNVYLSLYINRNAYYTNERKSRRELSKNHLGTESGEFHVNVKRMICEHLKIWNTYCQSSRVWLADLKLFL